VGANVTLPRAYVTGQRGYIGFSRLKSQIAARGGVRDPGAVAAAIGRRKYGKRRFQSAAARGQKLGRR
jgi:hypothetical protein